MTSTSATTRIMPSVPARGGTRRPARGKRIGRVVSLDAARGLLVLATVASRVRLDLVPGHPIELQPMVTLRPKYGVMTTVRAR